jgi:hypothetical protein
MSKKKARPMKSLVTAPPELDIPESKVNPNMGITPFVFQFLEVSMNVGQPSRNNFTNNEDSLQKSWAR